MHNDKRPVQGALDERHSDRVGKIRRNAAAWPQPLRKLRISREKFSKEVTHLQSIISTVTARTAETTWNLDSWLSRSR
jgi:hypothetical protein